MWTLCTTRWITLTAVGTLISFSTIAQDREKFINPEGLIKPTGYTHAVISGNTLYISGQVSVNEKGEVVGKGDLKAQVTRVYENLKICLQAAGATFDDIVKMNTYIVNYQPEQISILREVRARYLSKEHPPASTLVGVQALVNPDYLIEIEAVVRLKK